MFISDAVNSAGQNIQLCDVAVWWKLRNCFKLLLLQEWGGERGDCQAALAISALRVTWKNKNLKIKSEKNMRNRVIEPRRNRDYCWWELLSELKVLCFWNSPVSSLPRCVLCGQAWRLMVWGRMWGEGLRHRESLAYQTCIVMFWYKTNIFQYMAKLYCDVFSVLIGSDSFLLSLIHQTLTCELSNHRAVSELCPGVLNSA